MAALDPWADSAPFPSASDLTVPASGSTASAILPQARHPPTDVPTQGGRLFDEALDVGAGWGHDDVPETEASGPSQGASSPAQHIPSGHVSSRPEDSSAAHSAAIVKGVEEDSLSDDFRDAQDSPAPSDAHLHHSFAKATPNLPTSLPHQQSSGSTTDVQPSTTNFEDDFGDFDDAPSMRSDGHASDDAFGDFDEGAVASGGGLATTGQAVLSSSAASQASLVSQTAVCMRVDSIQGLGV
ncbi:hypothetical protein IE81DRAFT_253113 [Ceraceosorus guamensis]|uniref:Uncharacterized protein n=1 Tax=Ceraceosorus guamensis TaxID=1522189 RepID=A0A316W4S5_9BASI|nr:hypothetical protein IE81DRAFT_253113 [Ceraceosorus guamensis]PWN44722.1 hypothetical protein IE81DRAFT_253113 [Ceraceosorus guamensis]